MTGFAPESKRLLREQVKTRLRKLSPGQRREAGANAAALLQQQPVWHRATAILLYAPLADELDIRGLWQDALAAGKTVLLPRHNETLLAYEAVRIEDIDKHLSPGKFGVLEPCITCSVFPLNRLDLALVPGLAFDPTGGRLGRGGGFYDRLLAQVSGIKCGVAFDQQIVPQVPLEPHDIKLDCILTPTRWLPIGAVVK